jgi:hypothetical protein
MSSPTPEQPDAEVASLVKDLAPLIELLNGAYAQIVTNWTPEVDRIIRTGVTDINKIEWTLDYTLDAACTPSGFELFERLRMYLATLDADAAEDYAQYYKEMWAEDDNSEDFAETE